MTKREIATVQATLDYVRAMVDGQPHGVCGGVSDRARPADPIYLLTWVIPKLETLLDHARNKTPLPDWTQT